MSNFILVGLYFLILLIIGWLSSKNESIEGFTIANRKVGVFSSSASLFAILGGVILVGQVSLAFIMGVAAMWFWIGIALGMVILGLCSSRIKKFSDHKNFLTLGEYFRTRWGKSSGILSALIIFIAFLSILIAQFVIVGGLLSEFLSISYTTVILIVGLITLIYLSLGGYKAVIITDAVQATLMIVLLLLVAMVIPYDNFTPEQLNIFSLDWLSVLSFILLGMFTVIASADVWQRVFSAKNANTAKKSTYIVAVLFIIFGFVTTLMGMVAANSFPGANPDDAFFISLFNLMPAELLGFSVILVLAAVMSTVDTESFLLSSIISRDFLQKKKDTKKVFRIGMLSIVIISVLTAVFVSDIITLLFGLMSLLVILSPAIFFSFFWKLKDRAVLLSLVGGLLMLAVVVFTGKFSPDSAVLTFPASLVFLGIGQLFLKGPKN